MSPATMPGTAAQESPASSVKKPAQYTVFLDRDGVFDVAPRITVRTWKQFRWIPGAKQAFARLNQTHIKTCLATNQPYAGLGLVRLADIHAHMMEELREAGGRLDRIEAACVYLSRRSKPKPGMLIDGAKALGADPARSVMIGDNLKDAQAGRAYGAKAILIASTHSRQTLAQRIAKKGLDQVTIVDTLAEAVDLVLAWSQA
jgi:D-glycero-D-manno-heptose 1,7-bisphosphate phosphatase